MTIRIKHRVSLGAQSHYSDDEIIRLWQLSQTDLSHGGTFTGKPDTRIHADAKQVLKIRNAFRLEEKAAIQWITQAAAKERSLAVYHPAKTWLVLQDESNESCLIGNICPRLNPLHEVFETSGKVVDEEHARQWLDYLLELFRLYFQIAAVHGKRLDEGLSNFGLDDEQRLYYLDDDLYPWDKFVSCAHMLGVYLRMLRWLEPALAERLGVGLHEQIISSFGDKHYLTVLNEQLKTLFIPAAREASMEALLSGLLQARHKPKVRKPERVKRSGRYLALLADIHANLPALETVLDFLEQESIDDGLVLGDVVGYGPQPSACIQRLQQTDFQIIKGNHDHALAIGQINKSFSDAARWALEWSLQRVSDAEREWLDELPVVLYGEQWMAVHGAPIDPTFFNAYVYLMTYQDNLDVLQGKQVRLCFHGHTHLPGAYGRESSGLDREYQAYPGDLVELKRLTQALICPGSIGQPRNRQFGAQFAIYDRQEDSVSYHSLPYSAESLLETMTTEGFPARLLSHLQRGDA